MSTTGSSGSQFRGAIMGYNKADVDSYVARTEAEMKNREDQKEEWEQQKEEWKQQVAQLNAEIELLKKDLDAKQEEQQEQENHLNQLFILHMERPFFLT